MKHLKLFDTTAQYNAYTADTANFILPNVSLTVDNNTVHYNHITPPGPIPIEGDVQVFANPQCTEYPIGVVNDVYVRINTPWVGIDSEWETEHINDGTKFNAFSPTTASPNIKYAFSVWVDYFSTVSQNEPFTAGQVIKATTPYPADTTNYLKIFSKLNV